ncbi:MAG: hypothetical protein RR313_00070 [Anaerovoracaceae bacterium]
MTTWESCYNKNKETYIKVSLTDAEISKMEAVSCSMGFKSDCEKCYVSDGLGINRRWKVGLLGEYAVSKYLYKMGLSEHTLYDTFQKGLSKDFSSADFLELGYNLGCKTSIPEKVALVKAAPENPEVICVYVAHEKAVYICGIALEQTMLKYGDISLIDNHDIQRKGDKLGFQRYDKLLPVTPAILNVFKTDLTIDSNSSPTALKAKLLNNCVYVEQTEDEIHFLHMVVYNGQVALDEYKVPTPQTMADYHNLQRYLKNDTLYIGYRILPFIRKAQMNWGSKQTNLLVLDLLDVLSAQSKEFETITLCNDFSEAIRLLMLVFNVPLNFRLSEQGKNFMLIQQILLSLL